MQVVTIDCSECGHEVEHTLDQYPQVAECSVCQHLNDVI